MNSRSNEPWVWLEPEAIVAIHDEQITEHGGTLGVRDRGLLELALARPRTIAAYGALDAAKLAATYAIAIAHNFPFVDGNKRTAYVALELFLDQNGHEFAATDPDAATMMLEMAAGDVPDEDFIAWVRRHARARP